MDDWLPGCHCDRGFISDGLLADTAYCCFSRSGSQKTQIVKNSFGCLVSELYRDNLREDETQRVIAGSVLNGWKAQGWADFLGRFTCQITVLAERAPRRVLGWLRPNARPFPSVGLYLSIFSGVYVRCLIAR